MTIRAYGTDKPFVIRYQVKNCIGINEHEYACKYGETALDYYADIYYDLFNDFSNGHVEWFHIELVCCGIDVDDYGNVEQVEIVLMNETQDC